MTDQEELDRRKEQKATNKEILSKLDGVQDSISTLNTTTAVYIERFNNLDIYGCPVGKEYGEKIHSVHATLKSIKWISAGATAIFAGFQMWKAYHV